MGAGTIAARSLAIAMRSLMIATTGASPPAPWPAIVISPACVHVITAALYGPVVRGGGR